MHIEPDEPIGRTIPPRRTDPKGSHITHKEIRFRQNSQRARLLRAYVEKARPMTPEQAAEIAGIPPTANYWKRCSELVEAGYLRKTGELVKSKLGGFPELNLATYKGIKVIQRFDGVGD